MVTKVKVLDFKLVPVESFMGTNKQLVFMFSSPCMKVKEESGFQSRSNIKCLLEVTRPFRKYSVDSKLLPSPPFVSTTFHSGRVNGIDCTLEKGQTERRRFTKTSPTEVVWTNFVFPLYETI